MNNVFKEKVLVVVARIPRGKTLSYREVARLAGRPNAYRAVGNIMARNDNPKIPCHRVIRSDGTPGGYSRLRGAQNSSCDELRTRGIRAKILLLREEGAITRKIKLR